LTNPMTAMLSCQDGQLLLNRVRRQTLHSGHGLMSALGKQARSRSGFCTLVAEHFPEYAKLVPGILARFGLWAIVRGELTGFKRAKPDMCLACVDFFSSRHESFLT
jgi:hypothetical protein